ncbi:MAG: dTDP-4-dehydrorhamnose reductase [Rudaea sp.]
MPEERSSAAQTPMDNLERGPGARMRIAVTGHKGQLGRLVVARLETEHEVAGFDVPEFELTDRGCINQLVAFRPDLVVHNAAMTDVDGCARDPALAFRINALGTQNVALACQRAGAAMLYVSTNEVFDGEKEAPYIEFDTPNPQNPYARSKFAGEWYVRHLLTRFYIVRTAWLYARGGGKFPDKVLELARRGAPLTGVIDEIGSPTYAPDLVEAMVQLVGTGHFGIYHLVNSGSCSRLEWMIKILQLADLPRPVKPVTMNDYSRASVPPRNGALENFVAATALGIRLRPWQDALQAFFADA